MTPDMIKRLAEPFPDEAVSTRREITCDLCRGSTCMAHSRVWCAACGETVTTAHVHLDYVSVGYIRERLNEVDPLWNWAPMARTPQGVPLADDGSMWIELTVGGKTMIGVGDAPGLRGADRKKGAVSNALRNAAQGFGVALYLAKRQPEPAEVATEEPAAEVEQPAPAPSEMDATPSGLRARIREFDRTRGRRNAAQTALAFSKWSGNGRQFLRASTAELAEYLDHLLNGSTT